MIHDMLPQGNVAHAQATAPRATGSAKAQSLEGLVNTVDFLNLLQKSLTMPPQDREYTRPGPSKAMTQAAKIDSPYLGSSAAHTNVYDKKAPHAPAKSSQDLEHVPAQEGVVSSHKETAPAAEHDHMPEHAMEVSEKESVTQGVIETETPLWVPGVTPLPSPLFQASELAQVDDVSFQAVEQGIAVETESMAMGKAQETFTHNEYGIQTGGQDFSGALAAEVQPFSNLYVQPYVQPLTNPAVQPVEGKVVLPTSVPLVDLTQSAPRSIDNGIINLPENTLQSMSAQPMFSNVVATAPSTQFQAAETEGESGNNFLPLEAQMRAVRVQIASSEGSPLEGGDIAKNLETPVLSQLQSQSVPSSPASALSTASQVSDKVLTEGSVVSPQTPQAVQAIESGSAVSHDLENMLDQRVLHIEPESSHVMMPALITPGVIKSFAATTDANHLAGAAGLSMIPNGASGRLLQAGTLLTAHDLPEPPHTQLLKHIEQAQRYGNERIRVFLEPENLGPIDVMLEITRDKRLRLTMGSENATILALLQKEAPKLEVSLIQAGFDTQHDQWGYNLMGDQGFHQSFSQHQNQSAPTPGRATQPEASLAEIIPTAEMTYDSLISRQLLGINILT
jgi:flagellar hook-length control protein FliK